MALLHEALLCLTKAQEQEDAHFAAAQPEQKGKAAGPLQPKVCVRGCQVFCFGFELRCVYECMCASACVCECISVCISTYWAAGVQG
jgi:hypothetical protein